MRRYFVLCSTLLLGAGIAGAQTNVAPQAQQVLQAACQYLAETPQFGLTAEVWREHVTETGEKLQFTRTVAMHVKRPNRLHVDISSAYTDRGFWYAGQEMTILDRKQNLYSAAAMPETLDGAVDAAHDQFGVDLPLIDLALSDPYKNAMARVQTGRYLGMAMALGFNCHHLAFTQDNIDWQVWVQAGPQPLIRKFVITHKLEPGEPEFTGLIRDWDLVHRISESEFVFTPPRGASKVEMRKIEPGSGANTARASGATTNTPTGR